MKPAIHSIYNLLWIVAIILIAPSVHAMTLDQALDIIQSKYQKLNTLSARFTQTTRLELLGKTVTTTGTLQLKKPGKMRITYDGANSKNYISDGKTLWVVDQATHQTDTFKIGGSAVPKEALTFLNGFGDIRASFGVGTWSLDQMKVNGMQVQLVPIKETSYTALDCQFRPDGILQKMVIHNRSGNLSRYTFMEIQENPSIPDAQFTQSSQ
jgi:outer membrane lipoprotein carrier protein